MKASQIITQVKDLRCTGVAHHSNDIKPGYVYVAIRGANYHGSSFIESAINTGAKLIITDDPEKFSEMRDSLKVPVMLVKNSRKTVGILAEHFFPANFKRTFCCPCSK